MQKIVDFIFGMVIGVANIIPGVSGGTMMVMLNLYDRIIEAVANWRKDFKGAVIFLTPVLLGAAAGVLLFSKLIEYCLAYFPIATNLFFMGLILGSIPMIAKNAVSKGFNKSAFIPFLVTFAFMFALNFLSPDKTGAAITVLTTPVFIRLLLLTAVAAVAMIIPGLSGSFVMILLGTYPTFIAALSSFNIPIMVPIGLGVILGVIGGAKLIHILLNKWHQWTYFAILGFVFGSLMTIFPGFSFNLEGFAGIGLFAVGVWIALWFGSEKLQAKMQAKKNS